MSGNPTPWEHHKPSRPLNSIEKKRLFRRDLQTRHPMTFAERLDRLEMLRQQADELVRTEKNQRIIADLEKLQTVYKDLIRRDQDPTLSQELACIEFLITSASRRVS